MNEQLAKAPERALIERLQAGDRDAAAELRHRYTGYVERLVARTLGPDHEVQDVVNQVFARVLDQARTLASPAAFEAWLGSVTLSTTRALLRSRRTHRKVVGLSAPEELTALPVATSSREALRAVRRTQSASACLTAEERTVYALRFVERMELARIAATMGLSVSTVLRRLASAHQALQRAAQQVPRLRENAISP